MNELSLERKERRTKRGDTPYFSARLRQRLAGVSSVRSLLIEAPSGYGKTTIVQNYLRDRLPGDVLWVRHVCAEELPQAAWRRLCGAVSRIDAAAGETLLRLGPPDEDTQGEIAALLRDLDSAGPAWLVLDDFHHLAPLAVTAVWKALLDHASPRLGVALVTWPLAGSVMPYEKAGFLRLGVDDLRLTEQESGDYFAASGVRLPEDRVAVLHRRAEGWMIALSLHLRRWKDSGDFAPASGIAGLLRDVVWDGLDEAGRNALLRLSPFDSFTARQASFLLGTHGLPARARSALMQNALLRFDSASGRYYPHGTLLEFVREVFAVCPEERRRAILYAAAAWCAESGEREQAIAFYHRLGDYERILALDLSGMEDNNILAGLPGVSYADALRDIVAHCTTDMRRRHPLTMIQLAFEFFGQGCFEEFGALCAGMAALIGETDLPEREQDRLRGELLLLDAFAHYNDIAGMGERMKQAAELTGGATSLIALANSWTFGNGSVLLMYHREAGGLDAELADMAAYTPYYVAMTGGHGRGGVELMAAEALFCRGDAAQAEIVAHKARHEAAQKKQASILIGADLLLGRLAAFRGDAEALAAAESRIVRLAEDHPQKSNRLEADMARAMLMALAGRAGDAADWIRESFPGAFERRLFTPSVPFAHLCRAVLLLKTGKPEILLGEIDAALGLAQALHYPLALIYGHVHAAAAWVMRGDGGRARESVRAALELALPDGLLLPFAEHHAAIGPVLDEMESIEPDILASIRALAGRCESGWRSIMELSSARPPFGMTVQEYRTAQLAAGGLSNQEIAGRLAVSPNTVKTHLKAVYRKSRTSNRSGLREVLNGASGRPRKQGM